MTEDSNRERWIREMFRNATNKLDLSPEGQLLDGKDTVVVAEELRCHKTLRVLWLRFKSNVDEAAFGALANAIREHTTLQELSMKIGDWIRGASGDLLGRAMADAMKENRVLSKLILNSNGIGSRGAQAIADALKENSVLRSLDISGNYIGAVGASAMADALKENVTLQVLDLSSNEISVSHLLVAALTSKGTLREIYLGHNSRRPEGPLMMAESSSQRGPMVDILLENANEFIMKRLMREYRLAEEDASLGSGFSYTTINDNLLQWEATFPGPPDSPYQTGLFRCSIQISPDNNYPFKAPTFTMLTKVWHHFFDMETGAVCADILGDQWNPALTVHRVVRSIQSLLSEPLQDSTSSLNLAAAALWLKDRRRSDLVARHYTRLYAGLNCWDRPSGVFLEKKLINLMALQLEPSINEQQSEQLLKLIGRVRNEGEFTRLQQVLERCLLNPHTTEEELQLLEIQFDNPEGNVSLLMESVQALRPLVDEDVHRQCFDIARRVKTDEETKVVEEFLAECLASPTGTLRELEVMKKKLSRVRSEDDRKLAPATSWQQTEPFERPDETKRLEFFISHRGCDAKDTLAKPLHFILSKLGIPTFFDQHRDSIRQGEPNRLEMANGLYSSRRGVVIISDNFLESRWCQKELKTLYQRHRDVNDADFKLLTFFQNSRLIDHVPDFIPLKEIGSAVRQVGISDRQYLLTHLVPSLLGSVVATFPQLYERRNDIDLFAGLLLCFSSTPDPLASR